MFTSVPIMTFRPNLLSLSILVLAWIAAFNPVLAKLKGEGQCNRYLCVNATVHDNSIIYQMTSLRGPTGYLALGFGHRMTDSHMVVLWENDDGSTTISQRFADGHRMPEFVPRPPRAAWHPQITPASWHPHANTALSFEIQRSHGQLKSLSTDPLPTDLIWAFSYFRPNSSSPDADILGHFVAGSLKLDLNKDYIAPSASLASPSRPVIHGFDGSADKPIPYTAHELIVISHGTLAGLGFLVLLPLGTLVARWTRTITPTWFKVHKVSNYFLGLPLIAIGWLLGPLAVFDAQASHFLDSHQICGLILFGLYLSQILLGRYIHARRDQPRSSAHPSSHILHACFGLSIIALAFFQVRSGMDEWEQATGRPGVPHWMHIALKVWAVILPIAYLLGLLLLKRQFYQEKQGLGPAAGRKNYIALSSPASDSPSVSNSAFQVGDDDVDEFLERETKEIENKPLLRSNSHA